MTLTIEPDEFANLSALAGKGRDADDGPADAVSLAHALLRSALASKIQEAGLPWLSAPGATPDNDTEQISAQSDSNKKEKAKSKRRYARFAEVVAAIVILVVLWGGYARKWQWTGFQSNNQLWDWLSLLLLPVVVGTIPLWIRAAQHISSTRRVSYGVAAIAWVALVLAGYLIPLAWTGFQGQTLWNWLSLLLVPIAVAVTAAAAADPDIQLSKVLGSLRAYQVVALLALAAGWIVTIIGGYALGWSWTGYAGNTLWDWLQLLLLPVALPTLLLPTMVKIVAGEEAWIAFNELRKEQLRRAAGEHPQAREVTRGAVTDRAM